MWPRLDPESADGADGADEHHSKVFHELMLGFVRVHILHHAEVEAVYGSGIIVELAEHGYRMSWGAVYRLLHSLAAEGFLVRDDRVVSGRLRKYYSITPLGRRELNEARRMALDLVSVLADDAVGDDVPQDSDDQHKLVALERSECPPVTESAGCAGPRSATQTRPSHSAE